MYSQLESGKARLLFLIVAIFMLSLMSISYAQQAQGFVLEPRWSSPIGVLEGQEASVRVACPSPPSSLSLISPSYAVNITLFDARLDGNIYVISFKINVPSGLYDLEISCGTTTLYSPRSIVVFPAWPEKLRIAHITDTHIGLVLDNGRTSDSYLLEAILLSTILGSDLIIHTGDTVDVGAMSKDYYTLYKLTNLAGIPTLIVPGNHDYSGDSALTNYGYIVGKNVYYTRWGPYLFIGLDTGYYGRLTSQQLDFLEKTLEENKDSTMKILFFHHPVFNTKLVAKVNGDPSTLVNRNPDLFYPSWREAPDITARLLELVDKYNVNLVLSGHTHADGLVLYNNKTYFVTTVTTGGGVREGDYRGIKIIDVYANGTVNIVPRSGTTVFDPTIAINLDKTSVYYAYSNASLVFLLEGNDKDLKNMINQNSRVALRLIGNINTMLNQTIYTKAENVDYKLEYQANINEVDVKINSLSESYKLLIAISNIEDTKPPTIEIAQVKPSTPIAGKDRIEVIVKATDNEWGLKNIYVEYMAPGGDTYKVLAFPYTGEYYTAKLPLLPSSITSLNIRAVAVDLAEHQSTTDWIKVNFVVPTTTLTSSTPTQTSVYTTTTQTTLVLTTTTTQTATTQTTQEKPAETTTPTQSIVTATPTEKPSGAKNIEILASIVVLVVILVAVLLLRKK
jgi:3',5'-cyclic AMP phosphodiesterase CpdA